MYRNYYLMSWTCSEEENTNYYIYGDSENAFSGDGYMRIKDIKYSYGTGHNFVLYDKNNPSGLMMLAPNTNYRISAQAKYHDDAKLPNLRLWWYDPDIGGYQRVQNVLMNTKLDDVEGYTEISATITTGDKATGIAIGAVYLAEQDVYIDDVKVQKLTPVTIKFETNGGDAIDDISVIPYADLSGDNPGFAFKIGYDFVDWYLDKEFTKPFDFSSDTVTADTVLYAKFEAEADDGSNEDDFDFDFDFEDDEDYFEEEGALFGNSLDLFNISPREKTDATVKLIKRTDTAPVIPIWLIAVIAAGGAVLIGGGVLAFILIRRARRRKA